MPLASFYSPFKYKKITSLICFQGLKEVTNYIKWVYLEFDTGLGSWVSENWFLLDCGEFLYYQIFFEELQLSLNAYMWWVLTTNSILQNNTTQNNWSSKQWVFFHWLSTLRFNVGNGTTINLAIRSKKHF